MNPQNESTAESAPLRIERHLFCKTIAQMRRRLVSASVVLVMGLFAVLWGLMLIADQMNRSAVPLDSPSRCISIASLIPFVFAFVAILERLTRHPLGNCPECGTRLGSGMEPYLAIVTGRCPKCAANLFADDLPGQGKALAISSLELLSRADLEGAARCAGRAAVRPTLAWALSGALLLVLGGTAGHWLTDSLRSRLGDIWAPFVLPVMLIPGVSVGCWACAIWERRQRIERLCPHCSTPILGRGIACITGNCPACGQRAVKDPFPGMAPRPGPVLGPQWTAGEFHRLAAPRHKRLWIGCLVGGGLASVWAAPFMVLCSRHGNTGVPSEGLTLHFVSMLGVALFQCAGVVLWHRHSARDLHCPACEGELLQFCWLVTSSKRCYHCSRTVVGDACGAVENGKDGARRGPDGSGS